MMPAPPRVNKLGVCEGILTTMLLDVYWVTRKLCGGPRVRIPKYLIPARMFIRVPLAAEREC